MREIKFRGKSVDTSEWEYGLPTYSLKEDKFEIRYPLYDSDGYRGCSRYEVIPETVGQFTGMKDKNGKEIYEGDVVEAIRYDGLVVTGVVEFRDCSFVINTGYLTIYTWMDYQIEVIGNIHDNPELLVEAYD